MLIAEVLFWASLLAVGYVYIGYPLLLWVLRHLRGRRGADPGTWEGTVTLVVAAYNEERVIAAKLENALGLDYPRDRLEILVCSDGSTDATDQIVRRYAPRGVRLLRVEGRRGKTQCQNEAVRTAAGEVVVFTDATSLCPPEAVRRLVRHFADPRVGCVCGRLKIVGARGEGAEGRYWAYEGWVKRLEGEVSIPVGASGAIYAVRRAAYVPLAPEAISDFVEPLRVYLAGWQVRFEPEAVAQEPGEGDARRHLQRRIRMVMRAVYCLVKDRELRSLLDPTRHGLVAVQLWSHKVLRWLSGLFFAILFLANVALAGEGGFYATALAGQLAFYGLAAVGFWARRARRGDRFRLAQGAFLFCLSWYGMLVGLVRGLRGETVASWQPRGM
jgi:cellulose synthase/poly-beta-1,6-N-acetylglucosamine synthase-like glycosyltransferase